MSRTTTHADYDQANNLVLVFVLGSNALWLRTYTGADPAEGKRVTIPPLSLSLSLYLLVVICSRFFVVEVIFFVFLFLLRMTKGDNKKYQSHVFRNLPYFYGTSPKEDVGILTICVTLWYVNSIHNIIENVPQTYQRNIDKYIN